MSFLGLMTVKKHDEIVRDMQEKQIFALDYQISKIAVLEDGLEDYKADLAAADKQAAELRTTIRKLTPDAEKYRRRLAKEREAGQKRRASKAAAKASAKPVAKFTKPVAKPASKAKAGSK